MLLQSEQGVLGGKTDPKKRLCKRRFGTFVLRRMSTVRSHLPQSSDATSPRRSPTIGASRTSRNNEQRFWENKAECDILTSTALGTSGKE